MNANELADVFSCVMPSEKYYDEMQDAAFMLRQQQEKLEFVESRLKLSDDAFDATERKLKEAQAEIEFLKKEILEKHEDWKHEGQQAANARAEIEALKDELTLEVNEKCKLGYEIEALKAKLNADKFCDANCVWTDHHPDCQIGKAQEMKALDPLELAVLIEKNIITEYGLSEVVLCLRQQQAEIEALKLLLKRNQEPLGEEFEKVLKDNLWQLYEDSNK